MKNLILALFVFWTFCLNITAERLKVCYVTGNADEVKVDSICNIAIGDDEEAEAVALMNTETKMLAIKFYADYPAVNINIYKGDTNVVSVMRQANSKNTYYFDLSKRGKGLYSIQMVVHQDEDLCGHFEIK